MKRTEGELEIVRSMQGHLTCMVTKGGDAANNAFAYATQRRPQSMQEVEANAKHMEAVWNASNGMTTEEAVRYLTHGKEMWKALGLHCELCLFMNGYKCPDKEKCVTAKLIAKMEGK